MHGETSGNTIVKAESLPEDPYAMGCFFPDQIVECILVPDEHQRFLSTAVHVSVDISEVTATGKNPVRIFLKRQILTETYNPALPIYICVDCGRQFLSLAGMRYHCSAKVSVEGNIKESEKRTKRQAKIEVVRQQIHQSSHARKSDRQDRKKKVKARRAMYPEVLISLGFQLVKHDMHFSSLESLHLVNSTDRIVGYSDGKDIFQEDDLTAFVDPSDILKSLRREVSKQQRDYQLAAADQKHGAMYKDVFKSLGFTVGKTKPKPKLKPVDGGLRIRKRKLSKEASPASKLLPPIIDTRALAEHDTIHE